MELQTIWPTTGVLLGCSRAPRRKTKFPSQQKFPSLLYQPTRALSASVWVPVISTFSCLGPTAADDAHLNKLGYCLRASVTPGARQTLERAPLNYHFTDKTNARWSVNGKYLHHSPRLTNASARFLARDPRITW